MKYNFLIKMPIGPNFRIVALTIFLLLFAVIKSVAQSVNRTTVGEWSKLRIADQPGHSFFWKVYSDKDLLSETSALEAEFLVGKSGSEVAVKWNQIGEYYFTIQSVAPSGCSNLKVGKMEVLNRRLVANAGTDSLIGSCQQLVLDGSGSQGDNIRYEWSTIDSGANILNPGDKYAKFSLSSTYKGDLPCKFRTILKVTDQFGNSDFDTSLVEIDRRPISKIVINDEIDKNGYKILDGTSSLGSNLIFDWKTKNGTIIGDIRHPSIRAYTTGLYRLMVKDRYGCESKDSVQIASDQKNIKTYPDYGRCSWADVLIIPVIKNDYSFHKNIISKSLVIIKNPSLGKTTVSGDGTVKYTPLIHSSGRDNFVYKVFDEFNLCDSAEVFIDIYEPPIVKTNGFSPNGDGLNDMLVFNNLHHYPGSKLIVFTKSGQIIYKSDDYRNDWDGSFRHIGSKNNVAIAGGIHYYVLKLNGSNSIVKGFLYIAY